MYIADLHIHSKYSRATSSDCDAPHLDLWARRKGIGLVGTGDFTHPGWRAELREMLEPAGGGVYALRKEFALPSGVAGGGDPVRFVVSGEISTIYKKDGKTRKVHHVILLPGLDEAEELAHRLEAVGNLHSDGRPILGMDSRDLLQMTMDACPDAIFIPAHIWTPHFSVFGEFSQFSTLEECYGDMTGCIHALETGLSSDPPMNRRVSQLDSYLLVSHSDAHSPQKLGREANLLSCGATYGELKHALETGEGFEGTIEFFPEEGKYHLDGHRACSCCLEPEETNALNGRCPVCGRKLTVGVLHRVDELADRREPGPLSRPFESLMPLPELLANCMQTGAASKRVQGAYLEMLKRYGPEFYILRELPLDVAERDMGPGVAEALRRLRAGQVHKQAGYDGEYGVITVFEPHELELLEGQTSLLELAGFAAPKAKKQPVKARAAEAESEEMVQKLPLRMNPEQEEAIRAEDEIIAVVAGPGTGKTRTLVERIADLVERRKVPSKEITAVTFTHQAAEEMRTRLKERLGAAAKSITIGTFHAIALNLLEKKPLFSREQALALMAEMLEERGEKTSPAEMLRLLSQEKNGMEVVGFPHGLREAYDERMHELGARDLDDLLTEALALDVSRKPCFRHLLVDEFQDINPLQHQLVEHWRQGSLFVIGDPDQSIYGFRGADADCFDRLRERHPGLRLIRLKENYRSVPSVLEAALSVIDRNPGPSRQLHANVPGGAAVRLMQADDAFAEGVFITKEIERMAGGVDMLEAHHQKEDRAVHRAFSEMAVLCRTHRQLEQIEYCLEHDSIPCVVSGRENFWEDGKVRGMLGFFRSLQEPENFAALNDALSLLWKIPAPLIQRAGEALRTAKEPAALREELASFEVLAPWLDAADELWPQLAKAKPRKLLERLRELCGLENSRPVSRLLNASVFQNRMEEFLERTLLGAEGDLQRRGEGAVQSGAVRLMTLHACKGLEFPVVFLAGLNSGDLPLEREKSPMNVEEERRLFFVGMTRAREELIVSYGGQPSAFVDELPESIHPQPVRARRPPVKTEQLSLF